MTDGVHFLLVLLLCFYAFTGLAVCLGSLSC